MLEALGLPRDGGRRLHHRRDDGQLHVPRRRPPRGARARAGWDVEARRADRRAARSACSSASRSTRRCSCALRYVGFGADRADARSRRRPGRDARRRAADAFGDGPTIVCAQAGEVNSGAFDPLDAIADAAAEHGAWLHVDGAFGLWAAASPSLRHLVARRRARRLVGRRRAQVAQRPVRRRAWRSSPTATPVRAAIEHHRELPAATSGGREPIDYVARDVAPRAVDPDLRRAAPARPRRAGRAGRSLLRAGAPARRRDGGARRRARCSTTSCSTRCSCASATTTRTTQRGDRRRAARAARRGSAAPCGSGRAAARVSVSNWSTTEADIDRLAAALGRSLRG